MKNGMIKIVSNRLKSIQKEYGKMKMKSSSGKRWTKIVSNIAKRKPNIVSLYFFGADYYIK